MKNIHKIILSAFLLSSLSSCDSLSDFGDTNVNPGAVTTPVYSALLTNVQSGLGSSYAYDLRSGLYAQYFSETQYTETSRYSAPQLAFTGYYSGHLNDLQNIINNSGNANLSAIATILQQYIYLFVTNMWGDVPYSEALRGTTALLPKYDRQEDIYKGIFQKLGEAIAAFDNSPIAGDIIYAGNIDSWRRTANSLKLLAAIQLSKKVPATNGFAAQAFQEALAATGGVITTNAQNFRVVYPGGNYQSAYFATYLTRSDYAVSATLTDLLKSLSDNRQTIYGGASNANGTGATTSSSIGVPYGLERPATLAFTESNPTWARILRGDKRTDTSPVYLITAAQVTLARAEAADLGWTTESVATLYPQGISLSFEQWGAAYNAATYLTNTNVVLTAPGTNQRQIATQRFIASYPDGAQAWNIWRKSGYPALTPSPAPLTPSGLIPRRYVYTDAELLSNPESAAAAIALLPGGNNQDSRVWWDQP